MSARSKRKTNDAESARLQPWPISKRVAVSIALIAYLVILLLGPLSNPVGSDHLTRPMAKAVAPIHQAMFMGHGYRFFAPDPGASHLVEYKITQNDGTKIEGHFPNRDEVWPRLLYHRWFMLSETIYAEHLVTPIEEDFLRQQEAMVAESRNLKVAGNHDQAGALMDRRKQLRSDYENARKRIDQLVLGIASELFREYGNDESEKIELFVRERRIPYPEEILAGRKLDDPDFLAPKNPPKIGTFSREQLVEKKASAGGSP